eukprot:767307-Hanusia_phi.AAC.5
MHGALTPNPSSIACHLIPAQNPFVKSPIHIPKPEEFVQPINGGPIAWVLLSDNDEEVLERTPD